MDEGELFGAFLVASCILAAGTAWWLAKHRTGWSVRRVGMLAALPLPGIAACLCLVVILTTVFDALARPEQCGFDACAMAVSAGLVLLFQVLGVYGLALVPAYIATKLGR